MVRLMSSVGEDERSSFEGARDNALEIALSHSSCHMFVVDRAGTITYASRAGAKVMGMDRKEVIGKPWQEIGFLAERAEQIAPVIQNALESGSKMKIDMDVHGPSGSSSFDLFIEPVYESGDEAAGTILTLVDITEHKLIEKHLHESEERFRSLIESAPIAIAISRNLRHSYVNPAFLRMFGFSNKAEVIGLPILDLIAPQCRKDAERRVQLREKGVDVGAKYETIAQRQDGSQFPLDAAIVRTTINGSSATIAFFSDNTERARVEESLRESEERYRIISNAAFEGIVLHVNEIIVDMNEAFLELTGYSREELTGKWIFDIFAPDSKYKAISVVRNDQTDPYEAHLIRKNGEGVIAQIRGRYVGYKGEQARVAAYQEITDRVNDQKRIEEFAKQADEEKRRLATILDTLPVGVSIADAAGNVSKANEVMGQIWGDLSHIPKNFGEYWKYKGWWADNGVPLRSEDWPLPRAVREGITGIGNVIDIERADGTRGTVMVSAAPLRDIGGGIIGGVSIVQNITRQRRMEREAVEAKERAELYIDLLTHDINNMNAGVLGYIQLILEQGRAVGKDQEWLEKSVSLLKNSTHLIENVKKIQQLESPGAGFGPVDLGWAIEEVVKSFSGQPGKEVKINYRPQLKQMVIASNLLRDVFVNMIGNAIKHALGPVEINILVSKAYQYDSTYYMIVIEDDGPGIPDDVKVTLFSRMQRGRTKAGGSGLGLYLVKRLVEDYHGMVWVEDRVPGDHTKGARFVILLPEASSQIDNQDAGKRP